MCRARPAGRICGTRRQIGAGICAHFSRNIANTLNDAADWIELYNEGSVPVDLGGWYLTDNLGNPNKCRLPGASLEDRTDLMTGGWLGVQGQTNVEAAAGELREYTNAAPSGLRFFRIKARLQ
ncbi:MAG: lamin tail domain-containing protein [Lentisphaerales bacterium]|nr:MAG: lamin tail domain-containing protein [Lentisphaerales bacterium]